MTIGGELARPATAAPTGACDCPVCASRPRVLVAVRHPVVRRYVAELLERECGCWVVAQVGDTDLLAAALPRVTPDVLVIDSGEFPACCQRALAAFPAGRTIVVGAEPEPAYRTAALDYGAGAWLPREALTEQLPDALRQVLGCRHRPGTAPGG
ncbi:MAG: hypothetical protein ACOYY2_14530 [Actinomycetota bacterium]